MNIVIVGLGLIGGSMAKALKQRTRHSVYGLDSNPETVHKALDCGAVDGVCEGDFLGADLILIALYPAAAVEFVRRWRQAFPAGCTVIDLCGVKRFVCGQVQELLRGLPVTYIGGHPMAGRELSGFEAAAEGLFDGASMILTPSEEVPREALEWAEAFFLGLGFGGVTYTTPERHDEIIALTSQLAHVVSSAYVQNPAAEQYMGFSAGSFRDMTRVAKLHEEMWTELFLLNADFLASQTHHLIRKLEAFRDCIAGGKREELYNMLREGRAVKERLNEAES